MLELFLRPSLFAHLGITKAITDGIVKREDLFIASKLWNTYHKKENVFLAAQRSLEDLNITYFDLYLVHFPISLRYVPFDVRYPPGWVYDPHVINPVMEFDPVPLSETWSALEELTELGITKKIGENPLSCTVLFIILQIRLATLKECSNSSCQAL